MNTETFQDAVVWRDGQAFDLDTLGGPSAGARAEGVWAEVKLGGEHLRLLSEHTAQAIQREWQELDCPLRAMHCCQVF
jgi:hypothetical protein